MNKIKKALLPALLSPLSLCMTSVKAASDERSTAAWFASTDKLIILVLVILLVVFIILSELRRREGVRLKAAFEQEKTAHELADSASAAKGSFMSRMSHEIRTPLNAIIGYNSIARSEMSGTKTPEMRRAADTRVLDCLTKSDVASRHLLTIINDVLDMSAIENGRIQLNGERFDFKNMLLSISSMFYALAKAKNIEFEVVFDSLTEEWFIGDQMRLSQILTNLLSNAVKFTPMGGRVELKINQPEAEVNAAHIEFCVSDNGIGMSEEFQKNLFKPFEQEDSSISRRYGGTGLGLSISKNLVELMGGTIRVESKSGVGSTFIVDLTLQRTEQPASGGRFKFSDIRALVIDDDQSTCDYTKLLFDRLGAKCVAVTSGTDALREIRRAHEAGKSFNLCLVDWRMEDLDGIETVRRLREVTGDELPYIIVTAYDYTDVVEEASRAGISRFIAKPLFQSTLFDMLVNLLGISPDEEPEPPISFHGERVLLVEDNEMNMEIARRILLGANLTVETAQNGREALERFTASPPETYSAILMDVQMPVMNGHEATRAIRNSEHPEAKSIPIIAMTADAFAENVAEALESGMNEHISKPIDTDKLFETLNRFIKNKPKEVISDKL